jgi:exosortase A-associated hydrolase 2
MWGNQGHMKEKHYFFKNRHNQNLYADLFFSEQTKCECGIVLCPPIAEERNITRRIMVNAGRHLASAGYAVLLIDYFGEGDSEGLFEEATVESRVTDIIDAIIELKQKTGISKVGLLGMRLGATFAILVAQKVEDIAFVIAWQIVLNGDDYFQKWLRSNLAAQIVIHKKIISPREKLIEDLLQGELLEVDGYILTKKFYLQLKDIDLMNIKYIQPCRYFFLDLAENAGMENRSTRQLINILNNNIQGDYLLVKKSFDPSNMKLYDPCPVSLFETTINWLELNFKE